jgi:hypothetical protein
MRWHRRTRLSLKPSGAKPRKTRSASGAKGEPLNVSKERRGQRPRSKLELSLDFLVVLLASFPNTVKPLRLAMPS